MKICSRGIRSNDTTRSPLVSGAILLTIDRDDIVCNANHLALTSESSTSLPKCTCSETEGVLFVERAPAHQPTRWPKNPDTAVTRTLFLFRTKTFSLLVKCACPCAEALTRPATSRVWNALCSTSSLMKSLPKILYPSSRTMTSLYKSAESFTLGKLQHHNWCPWPLSRRP